MTTAVRQRMIEDMQLRGLCAKTQESYVRAVRQLAEYYHKSPDCIDEEELCQYLLYLKNDKRASASAFTIALCGIKFFYEHALQREWATLATTAIYTHLAREADDLAAQAINRVMGCLAW